LKTFQQNIRNIVQPLVDFIQTKAYKSATNKTQLNLHSNSRKSFITSLGANGSSLFQQNGFCYSGTEQQYQW
jgi:hypothetical protein